MENFPWLILKQYTNNEDIFLWQLNWNQLIIMQYTITHSSKINVFVIVIWHRFKQCCGAGIWKRLKIVKIRLYSLPKKSLLKV